MVVNFRTREINRDARMLTRTLTLIKKKTPTAAAKQISIVPPQICFANHHKRSRKNQEPHLTVFIVQKSSISLGSRLRWRVFKQHVKPK